MKISLTGEAEDSSQETKTNISGKKYKALFTRRNWIGKTLKV